mmetsp:Transcript_17051/g.35182  ORF Transcript_17051/g.35182 Transcript_17051/m.35182 type:complete len:97 (-) Transcript_17051:160-450(-)
MNPLGLFRISCTAFDRLKGVPPETKAACCIVLMVSNGANNNLEQPAARPLARLFLKPLTHAASRGLFEEVDAGSIALRLEFELSLPVPGRRLCGLL